MKIASLIAALAVASPLPRRRRPDDLHSDYWHEASDGEVRQRPAAYSRPALPARGQTLRRHGRLRRPAGPLLGRQG